MVHCARSNGCAFERFQTQYQDVFNQYSGLINPIKHSFQTIETALKQYTAAELLISWNGGKDATVLFHLIRFVCEYSQPPIPFSSIDAINIVTPEDFTTVREFACQEAAKYHINFTEIEMVTSIKETLNLYLSENTTKKSIFMGSRRSDPYCMELQEFSKSDTQNGWAEFMRINPILDWSYAQVWNFLQGFGISYCVLYDQGYTSLGSSSSTIPNPKLEKEDGSYLAAPYLSDDSFERAGRV